MNRNYDIYERLLKFGIRIVKFCKLLSKNFDNRVLANQLVRSGTSVGANMQEADAAASRKDFINKVTISKKEIQETNYWLKIIKGSDLLNNGNDKEELDYLLQESEELIKIIGSILSRTKSRRMTNCE